MTEPFLETVDVFLPGRGDTLLQSAEYEWERIGRIGGYFYRNKRGTGEIRVLVKGATDEQRNEINAADVSIPELTLWMHDYRGFFSNHTPCLIVTAKGTAIAVCVRRRDSGSDGGHDGDVMFSRSEDGGRSWSRQQVIFEEEGILAYVGPVIEDRVAGKVFASFWKIPTEVTDDTGFFHNHAAAGGVFYLLESSDEGRTWSEPIPIHAEPNAGGWMAWNNNSVHGIQLTGGRHDGRLVMPAFMFKAGEPGYVEGIRGGLMLSDDHGRTWRAGLVLQEGSDEVCVVQTGDDEIYISHRMNSRATGQRHFARSHDGGETVGEQGSHPDLACRNLHAGLIRDGDRLLFSNPPGQHMCMSVSDDAGRTWSKPKPLHPDGLARYSDLAVTGDGTIFCLYTCGKVRDSEKIILARFNRAWLDLPEP